MEDVRAVRDEAREIGAGDRRLDEVKRRVAAERREVAFLDRPRVVVGEAVDADHVGSVRHQPLGERRADEPGDAGDERLHRSNTSLARAGSRVGLPFRSSDACTVCPSATVAASTGRTTR